MGVKETIHFVECKKRNGNNACRKCPEFVFKQTNRKKNIYNSPKYQIKRNEVGDCEREMDDKYLDKLNKHVRRIFNKLVLYESIEELWKWRADKVK